MSSSFREEFSLSNLSLCHSDHTCFTNTQWRQLPSWAYPVWRLFWLLWHGSWLVVSGVRTQNTAPEDGDGVKWFAYASNWTFLLSTVFCLLDFVLVMRDALQRSRDANHQQPEVQDASREKEEILFHGEFTLVEGMKISSTPCSAKLQWFLFEAVNCTNLLTTIVYWASQHQDGDTAHADVIVFNVINTVFVIANVLVTGIPVRILHFVYPAVFIAFYFLFNLIYFLADGTSITGSDVIFRPLDWNEAYPTAFTILFGLLVAVPLGHLIFFSIFTMRVYLHENTGEDKSDVSARSDPRGTYRKRDPEAQAERSDTKNGAQENAGFELGEGTRR